MTQRKATSITENSRPMQFGLTTALLCTAIAALLIGWWVDRSNLRKPANLAKGYLEVLMQKSDVFEVQVREIGKLLESAKTELQDIDADKRQATIAINSGRETSLGHLRKLIHTGKMKDDGMKMEEPERVLRMYIQTLDVQISDIQNTFRINALRYHESYNEARRIAVDIEAVEKQMGQTPQLNEDASELLQQVHETF